MLANAVKADSQCFGSRAELLGGFEVCVAVQSQFKQLAVHRIEFVPDASGEIVKRSLGIGPRTIAV